MCTSDDVSWVSLMNSSACLSVKLYVRCAKQERLVVKKQAIILINMFLLVQINYLPTYPLRSRWSIRSTQDVATQLCSLLWPPLLPRLDSGSSVHFRWFFAKLFLVFLLVFCLLVSTLELSLVLMIYPFLRRTQAR